MQDYLKQAKSFLAQNSSRLALRAIPIALVAVAAAHATPTFNAPSTTSISSNTCSGAGTTGGSLTGVPTTGGVSLSGNVTLTNTFSNNNCTVLMVWKGTGSGTFNAASYSSSFVMTPPSDVTVSAYTLTILINGVAQPPVTCSFSIGVNASLKANSRLKPRGVPTACSGSVTVPLTNISASGTLATYEADLSVTGYWYGSFNSQPLNISIPSGATIDIFASGPTVTPAPALSPVALAGTTLLLALAAFRMSRWKTASSGPGPQGSPGPQV